MVCGARRNFLKRTNELLMQAIRTRSLSGARQRNVQTQITFVGVDKIFLVLMVATVGSLLIPAMRLSVVKRGQTRIA
jgi:hypothetical protein